MTTVDLPGSKSITARALFLAACADGISTLIQPLVADDTVAFADALAALGYSIERDPGVWKVHGLANGPMSTEGSVHCCDAGTAARFLPVLAALGHGDFDFDSSEQMRRRPVAPLVDALRVLGADIAYRGDNGHLPLTVHASGVKGGALALDAALSSQFLTALLMGAPLTEKGLSIACAELVSVPYIEMTLAMIRAFGAAADRFGTTFEVPAGSYRAREYRIEPDASTASYFLAAAALCGRTVTVPGLGANSLQGDLGFIHVLQAMGAQVVLTHDAVTVTGPERLSGVTVNMRDISDTMPTLAAIAPLATGPVRIEDVYNTRVKECDRLDTCAENLRNLGVEVGVGRDWIEIQPGTPVGTQIETRGDHRIAMAFGVLGLQISDISFDDPECVSKTFPEFHKTLAALSASWHVNR